jgi:hypothetical protein
MGAFDILPALKDGEDVKTWFEYLKHWDYVFEA